MSLSCSCNEYDGDGWYHYGADGYTTLDTKRWRKCCSCKALIRPGDLCAKFNRAQPTDDYLDPIKYKIWGGDECPLPPWFMCEGCADQYFNLEALGFCVTLGDNMMNLLREYVEMKGST